MILLELGLKRAILNTNGESLVKKIKFIPEFSENKTLFFPMSYNVGCRSLHRGFILLVGFFLLIVSFGI